MIEQLMATQDFYGSGLGDVLINSRTYPKDIRVFLRAERRILDSLSNSVELLIEVGCMGGRHIDWAVGKGIRYLGIDLAHRYIIAGNSKICQLGLNKNDYQIKFGDASEMDNLLRDDISNIEPRKCLVFLPFNCFGNLDKPARVAEKICKLSVPFFFTSYAISNSATLSRQKYYVACGFRDLQINSDSTSVVFTSPDGLHSAAYAPEYVTSLFSYYNIIANKLQCGRIGIGYFGGGVSFFHSSK
jgi:hypothetical protein